MIGTLRVPLFFLPFHKPFKSSHLAGSIGSVVRCVQDVLFRVRLGFHGFYREALQGVGCVTKPRSSASDSEKPETSCPHLQWSQAGFPLPSTLSRLII
jgi:hypothetical protein